MAVRRANGDDQWPSRAFAVFGCTEVGGTRRIERVDQSQWRVNSDQAACVGSKEVEFHSSYIRLIRGYQAHIS